jgi:hypothetical protein
VNDTGVALGSMLKEVDARFPGVVFGVQLTTLSTGEWMVRQRSVEHFH